MTLWPPGQDREVSLTGVSAISSMVAPVVLITMGGLVANGLLFASTGLHNRMWDLAWVPQLIGFLVCVPG
jgi:hypothetical protein